MTAHEQIVRPWPDSDAVADRVSPEGFFDQRPEVRLLAEPNFVAGQDSVQITLPAGAKTVAQLQGDFDGGDAGSAREVRLAAAPRRPAESADDRPEHVAQLVRAMMAQEER